LTAPDENFPGGTLRLKQCTHCRTVFLNPRMTLTAIEALEDSSTVYDMGGEDAEEHISNLDGLLAALEADWVPRGKLLDVGCNRGFLLEAARRRGWTAVGVELSEVAAARARKEFGATVHRSVDEVGDQDFNLVVAWQVLEHTLNPVAFLSELRGRIAPGGLAAIQVPSLDQLAEFRARDATSSLVCAVHNFYFTARTIATVIELAGLTMKELKEDDVMLTAICSPAPLATAIANAPEPIPPTPRSRPAPAEAPKLTCAPNLPRVRRSELR
jgi:2-polyprenyl-3-methyl-5-hydroxy-6-metoxy-1,4-benzoquinol methylase